ncbi:MAG: hypothetical protein H7Y32_00335 [Chloroflexales bacterium]|nr:hypothetical protein [Chloroflexales bacterium]
MIDQELHEMHLAATHASGAQEWACNACGRRMLFHHQPTFKKIVLVPGNVRARHSGGTGDVQVGTIQSTASAESFGADAGYGPHASYAEYGAGDAAGALTADEAHLLHPWIRAINAIERENLEDLH